MSRSDSYWDTRLLTERGVAEEAKGVGRIPPDVPVGRDTDERLTDLGSRSLDVPRSVSVRSDSNWDSNV